jgi:hypothetical protein
MRAGVAMLALAFAAMSTAQTPAAPDASTPAAPAASTPAASPSASSETGLGALGWLSGCWRGSVNQREFREQWLPLRGNLLLGVGHTVAGERTQDFEYLRIEQRADGIHYVATPVRQKEAAFRLVDRRSDGADAIFTFANPSNDFPQSIVYRRGTEGWLYVHVEGKLGGEDRRVIYPFRRVDCETDELIRN